MASQVGSHYYYLTGRPAQVEEMLQTPLRLSQQWWIDTHVSNSSNRIFDPPRYPFLLKMGSIALWIPGLVLQGCAWMVDRLFHEKIAPEFYDHEVQEWQKRVVGYGSSADFFIPELIRSRIQPQTYDLILYLTHRDPRRVPAIFAQLDGICYLQLAQLNRALTNNQRCLFILHGIREYKWTLYTQEASQEDENRIYLDDPLSRRFKAGRVFNDHFPRACDCLVLIPEGESQGLEDPKVRSRLKEVLNPPQGAAMVNPTGSHYYYLTGRPGQVEEMLQTPYRLSVKLWTDVKGYRENIGPQYSRLQKLIWSGVAGCLVTLGLPLRAAAALVNLCFREKIDPKVFQEQMKKWDDIIFLAQNHSDRKERLIHELIRARIKPGAYHRILYTPRETDPVGRAYFVDGDWGGFKLIDEIVNKNEKCLFLVQSGRFGKWNAKMFDISIDSKSDKFKKYLQRDSALTPKCDVLLLTTRTSYIAQECLENPKVRRRLQAVLSPQPAN